MVLSHINAPMTDAPAPLPQLLRRETVLLPARQRVSVVQPLPQPPASHAPQKNPIPPPVRLLVDVLSAHLPPAAGGATGGGPPPGELFCVLSVASAAADFSQQVTWGMVTRAVAPGAGGATASALEPGATCRIAQRNATGASSSGAGTGAVAGAASTGASAAGVDTKGKEGKSTVASWRERFIVNLPLALVEQLLTPAPGDNPFAGTAVELRLALHSGAGAEGLGRLWGTASVPVLYSWLATQVTVGRFCSMLSCCYCAGSASQLQLISQCGENSQPLADRPYAWLFVCWEALCCCICVFAVRLRVYSIG